VKVSLLQLNSGQDQAANLDRAERLARDAIRTDQPDLLVLPELFAFLGASARRQQDHAERVDSGPTTALLQRLAREGGVTVHGGSFLERDGDRFYNTTVACDPEGRVIARYRKIHLFDVETPGGRIYRESDVVSAGTEVSTYDVKGVRIGCSICYDLRFGELYRRLAGAGARVIAVPAAFTLETGKDHWEVLLRARAIETQTWIVAAAQTGTHETPAGPRQTWGRSMVVDPWGRLVCQLGEAVGYVTATLDFAYQDQVRERLPVHRHARLGS